MYTIYLDGELLYSPLLASEGYGVGSPKLTLELNKAGSLEFLLPPNNVRYNNISKLKSIVTVYQDDEEIFRGRVLHDTRDFYNRKSVYCEGELSFLIDSIQRPYKFDGTFHDLFAQIINTHNNQVDEFKRFTVGIIESPDIDETETTTVSSDTTPYRVYCSKCFKDLTYDEDSGIYTCPTCGETVTLSSFGVPSCGEDGHMRYMSYVGGSEYKCDTCDFSVKVFLNTGAGSTTIARTSIFENAEYTNTLDLLISKVVNVYGGYLRIRLDGGIRYIDYVQEYGTLIDQTIEFGVNLLDISEYISADEVFTVLVPLGASKQSDEGGSGYVVDCVSDHEKVRMEPVTWTTGDDTDESPLVEHSGLVCPICYHKIQLSEYGVPKCVVGGHYMTRTNASSVGNNFYTCTDDSKDPDGNVLGETTHTVNVQSYSGATAASDVITIESVTDLTAVPEGMVKDGDHLEDTAAIALFGRICRVQRWDDVESAADLLKKGVACLTAGIEMAVSLTVKAVDLHLLQVDISRIELGSYVRVLSKPHWQATRQFLCSKITVDLTNPDKTEFSLGASYTSLTESQANNNKATQSVQSTVATAQNAADRANRVLGDLNQASIFKLLTNNGQTQGMILDETTGNIYINASYIQSGTLTLGGDKPKLQIVNDDGVVCVVADKNGIRILDGEVNATSGTLESMTIVEGIAISSKDANGVKDVPLISIEPYVDASGKTLYQIVFGYDNRDPNKGNTTVVFDFDDVHLKNALHFDRDNTEKQIHFKTKTADGTYQHNCKIYGGNSTSPIGIGVYSYDDDGVKRVWAYDDQQKHLVSDVKLASYDLDISIGDGASSVENYSICQQLTKAAHLHARFTSNGIAANTTKTLGTIDTKYAPAGFDIILSAYTANTACDVFLTSKGHIKIKSPNAIAAGEKIFINGIWMYE